MADPVVKILDTANPTASPSDTGIAQKAKAGFLKKDKPLRFSVDLATDDVLVVETRSLSTEDYEVVHTFTSETPADIYVSADYQGRRLTDGGVGDSQMFVENRHNQRLTEDSAT